MRADPAPARTGKGRRQWAELRRFMPLIGKHHSPHSAFEHPTLALLGSLALQCLYLATGPPQLGAETSLQCRVFRADSLAAKILQLLSNKRNLCASRYSEGLEETLS